MKMTRRTLMAGAAAIPAVVGLERLSAKSASEGTIFVYDKSLPDAEYRRAAAVVAGQQVCEITGDRIRFARDLVSLGPARIGGFSRQADALLIEEVAAEAGYRRELLESEGAAISWYLSRRT